MSSSRTVERGGAMDAAFCSCCSGGGITGSDTSSLPLAAAAAARIAWPMVMGGESSSPPGPSVLGKPGGWGRWGGYSDIKASVCIHVCRYFCV